MHVRSYVCLASVLLFFTPSTFAGRVYAIVVADTNATSVGDDAAESAFLVSSCLKGNVAPNNLVLTKLSGDEVTRRNIFRAIDRIPAGGGHSIFFYYVGHGYYNQGSQLAPVSVGKNYIRMPEIVARIDARKPFCMVTINDSCSRQPKGQRLSAAPVLPDPNSNTPLGDKLFFHHAGWFHINSSAPGEYALSHRASLDGAGREVIVSGTPFAWAMYEAMSDVEESLCWHDITPIIANKVSKYFRDTATNGRVRLFNGVYQQADQTVRGMENRQLFHPKEN